MKIHNGVEGTSQIRAPNSPKMRSKRGPRYERADNEQQEVWPPGDARARHTCPLQKGDARPLNEHPKDQNPRLHDLETGRSRRRDPRDRGAKKPGASPSDGSWWSLRSARSLR